MKFLHLADLHIGKRVNEISMLSEQEEVLRQILQLVRREQPDAVLLAGDIYDKPTPGAEAVQLFDGFLTELSRLVNAVLIIAGNHDSAERLAFAAGILRQEGVYIAPPYDGELCRVELADEFGVVDFYLLPFVKPLQVRRCFPDEEIPTYNDAVGRIMRDLQLVPGHRSVLLAHQLITGSVTCESEELAVGGLDNVDVAWFDGFDYVALGHLHSAQTAGRAEVRYAGSPLKYSFSEARQRKSCTLVELSADGSVDIQTCPLVPLHDMREIRGSFAELISPAYVEGQAAEDYLHITLTDEEDVLDALARLRQIYPNLMKLDYDNRRTRERQKVGMAGEVTGKSPLQLFAEFYRLQNNQDMSDEQSDLLTRLISEIWEDEPTFKGESSIISDEGGAAVCDR
jgi:exonuclease SbcD